jgi:hypothetical protein
MGATAHRWGVYTVRGHRDSGAEGPSPRSRPAGPGQSRAPSRTRGAQGAPDLLPTSSGLVVGHEVPRDRAGKDNLRGEAGQVDRARFLPRRVRAWVGRSPSEPLRKRSAERAEEPEVSGTGSASVLTWRQRSGAGVFGHAATRPEMVTWRMGARLLRRCILWERPLMSTLELRIPAELGDAGLLDLLGSVEFFPADRPDVITVRVEGGQAWREPAARAVLAGCVTSCPERDTLSVGHLRVANAEPRRPEPPGASRSRSRRSWISPRGAGEPPYRLATAGGRPVGPRSGRALHLWETGPFPTPLPAYGLRQAILPRVRARDPGGGRRRSPPVVSREASGGDPWVDDRRRAAIVRPTQTAGTRRGP